MLFQRTCTSNSVKMSVKSEASSIDEECQVDTALIDRVPVKEHETQSGTWDIFSCIIRGDLCSLRTNCLKVPVTKRKESISGPIQSRDPLNISYTPTQLAACMGKKDILDFLLSQNADVTTPNVHGKNVIHLLVDIAKHRPKLGFEMYEFVMERCSDTDKKELLNARYKNCPPHVYAIKNGNLPMADLIIHTDGVYRHVMNRCGTYNVVRYDLHIVGTDPHECPISTLTGLGLDQVKIPENREVILRRPWATWLSQIWSEYVWVAFVWFIGRFIHLCLLTFCCINRPMRMNPSANSTLYEQNLANKHRSIDILILICAGLAVFSNAWRLLYHSSFGNVFNYIGGKCKDACRTVCRIKKQKETHLTQGKLYWVLSVLMHISYIMAYTFALHDYHFEDIMLSLSVVLCYLSMLFFCTMIPKLGHFSIIIEQTVYDIINFAFFYLFILLGFSAGFYTLYQMEKVDEFMTYPKTIFTVFHMTFDPVGFTTLHEAREPIAAVICFVIYVIIVIIALLNFLIAILSQTVADITDSKHIAFSMNRASVALFLQKYPLVRKLRRGVLRLANIVRCERKEASDGVCSVTVVEYVKDDDT